jgi:hypothetical protein
MYPTVPSNPMILLKPEMTNIAASNIRPISAAPSFVESISNLQIVN